MPACSAVVRWLPPLRVIDTALGTRVAGNLSGEGRRGRMFWTRLGHGLAAGAVGVTTLNAITYLDMAVRARPSSDTPSQAVEQLAAQAGTDIPGEGSDRQNRLAGLGPLAGIATGAAVGVTAALTWPALAKIPASLAAALLGALAMAGSDGPLVALGLTQPKDWAAADWASDAIPHLGYGAAAYATLAALNGHPRAGRG